MRILPLEYTLEFFLPRLRLRPPSSPPGGQCAPCPLERLVDHSREDLSAWKMMVSLCREGTQIFPCFGSKEWLAVWYLHPWEISLKGFIAPCHITFGFGKLLRSHLSQHFTVSEFHPALNLLRAPTQEVWHGWPWREVESAVRQLPWIRFCLKW